MESLIFSPGPEGVFALKAGKRSVFLLWRADEYVLIGAGGPDHMPLLRQALQMRGAKIKSIKAILLTHAEVMLSANAARIRDISGAKIYVNRLDAPRLSLHYPGTIRHAVRARMEKRNSRKIGYVSPSPVDFYIDEADVLDLWYGISVLSLPGPTPGHCGFYCRHNGVLFCGALMEERGRFSRYFTPPPYDNETLEESRKRVRAMNPPHILSSIE